MKPNYVAKRSAWAAWSPLSTLITVLLFWTIVPIIVQIFRTISTKHYCLEFYDDKIIRKSGWLSTNEHEMVFMGILTVSISRSFWGNLFNYGTIKVNCVGEWDLFSDMEYIQNPEGLKKYLQTKIVTSKQNPNTANMSTNMFVHM